MSRLTIYPAYPKVQVRWTIAFCTVVVWFTIFWLFVGNHPFWEIIEWGFYLGCIIYSFLAFLLENYPFFGNGLQYRRRKSIVHDKRLPFTDKAFYDAKKKNIHINFLRSSTFYRYHFLQRQYETYLVTFDWCNNVILITTSGFLPFKFTS